MKNSMKSWNKGFTLIELLASIVILGILAVIVTPLAIKYLDKAKEDISTVQESKVKEAAKLYYDECVNGDGTEVADLEEEGHTNVCTEFDGIIEYHNGEITDQSKKNTCVTLEKLVALGYIKPVYIEGGLYSANIYIASESKADAAYTLMTNRCFGFMPGEATSSLLVIDEAEEVVCDDDDEECKSELAENPTSHEYTSTVNMNYMYNYNRTCEYIIDPNTSKLSTYDDTNKTTDEIRQECLNG